MQSDILGLPNDKLTELSANLTAIEIFQQPELWQKTFSLIIDKKEGIQSFFNRISLDDNFDIIFAGAGTSAYIGNSLRGIFKKNTGLISRAIATTDIVTHPHHYFLKDKPTLLISFARSGESPESLAAIQLANQICSKIFHLIITCNNEGELAVKADKTNSFVIVLPPESNDQSLAMTGSFTAMLLNGILLSKISSIDSLKDDICTLSEYGEKINNDYTHQLKEACKLPFERAVFLGSGPLMGSAEESHLKLQELTDGKIISKFDSFLGFRHGPKAVINNKTLMIYFLSSDPYVLRYEINLIKTINLGERGIYSIGVMENDIPEIDVDLKIILSTTIKTAIDIDFLVVVYTLVGQLLGMYKSLELGLKPDTPSESGTITRVVQGVKIYPY
ncbi:SIS domain-containing protein [candidate division KSB1 bacterium]|nr:SIS domain-containing protein [candidate division KSB1 bacterium]